MMVSHSDAILEQLRIDSLGVAEELVDRFADADPVRFRQYGEIGRQRCIEDAQYHLRYLLEAVASQSAVLFTDYVEWARILLDGRGICRDDLQIHLELLRESIRQRYASAECPWLCDYLDAGIHHLKNCGTAERRPRTEQHRPLISAYLDSLLRGDRRSAMSLILDEIESGLDIRDLYLEVFQEVQYEIGWLWQTNRISVAQEHFATAVTQLVMSRLYPKIMESPRVGYSLVCACVGSELHEIGTRMIADLFELAGWDTTYLGASTPVSGIVQQVVDRNPQLVALSTTMTYHLPQLRETIANIRRAHSAKVLVGGRPFNLDPELWQRIGADGYAADAGSAVAIGESLLSARKAK